MRTISAQTVDSKQSRILFLCSREIQHHNTSPKHPRLELERPPADREDRRGWFRRPKPNDGGAPGHEVAQVSEHLLLLLRDHSHRHYRPLLRHRAAFRRGFSM